MLNTLEKTTTETQVNAIRWVDLLWDFVHQRPGFDLANYGGGRDGYKYYRQDYMSAYKDFQAFKELHFLALRRFGSYSEYCAKVGEYLLNASGRLSGRIVKDCGAIQYCTGQYFPTEYRGAACRVLVSLIWDDFRDEKKQNGEPVYKDGHAIRKAIKNALRTRNAKSWFN